MTTPIRDNSTMLVVYRGRGRSYLARVDLNTKKVVNTAELPPFGPEVR